MLQIAIIGFGNVGKRAFDAVRQAPDMALARIVEAPGVAPAPGLEHLWTDDINHMEGGVDAAILCLPSRLCPDTAEALLGRGVHTVDAYDIHGDIWGVKSRLDIAAKASGAVGVVAAGWDPGTDSVQRALMEAMAPRGITFTDFGPGMSMGHSVAARAVPGVRDALSMTIPVGAGVHNRVVYVQLEPGADFSCVEKAIQSDEYFAHDNTHVRRVDDVSALLDVGHGVRITRKGVAGATHNQLLEYTMRINGPAVTAQVMVSAARAAAKRAPGCYTLIELPPIDLLPGEPRELINRLV